MRYVRDEGRAVAEVLVRRLGLTGGDREWLFVDASAQVETSDRVFRSAVAEVYAWGATRPEDVRNTPHSPLRGVAEVRLMGSVYAGRRLPAGEALGGFGVRLALGMVGPYGGLYLDLTGRVNDPAAVDVAVEPDRVISSVGSILVRIDPGW